jgi:DDE family transposase/DDE superfamily endonuclease
MAVSGELAGLLEAKFAAVFPHLDERQRRLVAGAEARSLGHGGIRAVARAAGMAEVTVSRGVAELEAGQEPLGRARAAGGGRKPMAEADPGLVAALLALVEPEERGDPQSPLRWTTKSTRKLAGELTGAGHRVSADTVGELLREQGFSLQANARTIEGRRHPDRDAQFRYISEQASEHMAAGQPVISVDAKKKEQVGQYARAGREWRPGGSPVQARSHDFPDEAAGKAIPYGIYDLAANTGWVSVGTDGNTAAFAVESVRRWWDAAGRAAYPGASRLLITADAGGSNGYRTRAWKAGLARLAAATGLEITCCHFPPGTSKWNKIEHRLFSHISMNWRGRPLTSHEVIVNTIAATTTRTGLRVHAELDPGSYPTGIKISDQQMAALPLTPRDFHGDWNYTLHPRPPAAIPAPPPATTPPPARPRCDQAALSRPALTGIPRPDLAALTTALTTAWNARHEADRYQRRGGPRRTRPGPAPRRKLDLTDHILATVLHQRLNLPRYLLAPLFGVDAWTIGQAITRTRPLLDHHLPPIQPAPRRDALLRDLCHHAQTAGVTLPAKIKQAC